MYTELDRKRVASIYTMIIEMSGGNFSYIIERSDKNDDLETLVVLLNMMAEEMRETFHHYSYINPHETYKHSAQLIFILNADLIITGFSPSVRDILLLEEQDLHLKSLSKLLTPDSLTEWEKEKLKILKNPGYKNNIKLNFKTNNSLNVPAYCSIASLVKPGEKSPTYMISAISTILQSKEDEQMLYDSLKTFEQKAKLKNNTHHAALLRRASDIETIRAIYDHILKNLEKPLQNLKSLANEYGTNEFKLKKGFNQLYNTSVFRLQREERLKLAHYRIQQLDQPLNSIALELGFKNYAHFSKLFKKHYGYTPNSLKNKTFLEE